MCTRLYSEIKLYPTQGYGCIPGPAIRDRRRHSIGWCIISSAWLDTLHCLRSANISYQRLWESTLYQLCPRFVETGFRRRHYYAIVFFMNCIICFSCCVSRCPSALPLSYVESFCCGALTPWWPNLSVLQYVIISGS